MKLLLQRDTFFPATDGAQGFTLGRLYADGVFLCYTCEDEDRRLEADGDKIKGATAIPRGTYSVGITFSHRFQKPMIEVFNVPDFAGIRIHAGNKAEDSEGCVLVGQARTQNGVANCRASVDKLFMLVQSCEDTGEPCTLTVE